MPINMFLLGIAFVLIVTIITLFNISAGMYLYNSKDGVGIGLKKLFNSISATNKSIIKNFVMQRKEVIYLGDYISILASLILLGFLIVITPLAQNTIINLISLSEANVSIMIKIILLGSLTMSFSFLNPLKSYDLYNTSISKLNIITVVLLNLVIIGDHNFGKGSIIVTHLGVGISFLLIAIVSKDKFRVAGNSSINKMVNGCLNELIWIVFFVSFFLNVNSFGVSIKIEILITFILVLGMLWCSRILDAYLVNSFGRKNQERIMLFAIIISLVNYVGLVVYDSFF
jgi:hypothetical protein